MMSDDSFAPDGTSRFVTAQDGLKLHLRRYGPRRSDALTVVCLPGLARTAADFHILAMRLANDPERPRAVIALDSRGRGQSQYDEPTNYNLAVELADLLAVLTALELAPAAFVGTSRGGLLTMLLAAARPGAIAGVVLNDIGPVIEPKGLMRIKGYVGKLPEPRDLAEGAEILRRLFDSQFPKQTAQDWLAAAERTWEGRDGRLVPTYDIRLAKTLESIDPEQPVPSLWKEFDALSNIPLMVIRGEKSDMLAPATVEAMRARRNSLEVIEVPDQGHAPLLVESDILHRIADFIAACETGQ